MLSVSVEGAIECQLRVNDVFLRCVFELSVPLEKTVSAIFFMLMPWAAS